MDPTDRIFLAQLRNQKYMLEAIAADMNAVGIKTPHTETSIRIVEVTIDMHEAALKHVQEEKTEEFKRNQERGQEWIDALRSRASEPTSSEEITTKSWKTWFRRS